jgi:hypothetical protein
LAKKDRIERNLLPAKKLSATETSLGTPGNKAKTTLPLTKSQNKNPDYISLLGKRGGFLPYWVKDI